MKATELRIGNLVTINNELLPETKNEIYKVYGLNAKFDLSFPDSSGVVSLNHTKSIRIYSQFDEFIEPIPLTEEWLLKFGFEKDEYAKDFRLGKYWVENRYFDSYEKSMFLFGCYQFNKIYITSNVDVLKYVHELQNLYFAITGEELTI